MNSIITTLKDLLHEAGEGVCQNWAQANLVTSPRPGAFAANDQDYDAGPAISGHRSVKKGAIAA